MRTELAGEERHHLYWETALDRLELDVLKAERMLEVASAEPLESWDEPQLAGPIPADLVERALALRARQEQVMAALTASLGDVRRQHEFAERVDRATGRADRPVYLDLDA